jgi:protein SCO1/2
MMKRTGIQGRRARVSLLTAFALAACQPYQFRGTEYIDPSTAPDFELTRADGSPLRLSDLRPKVVLLFFGFTSCPDVCPTTLADGKRILEGLGQDVDRAAFLFVTVDPDRDTPEVMGRYAARFHPAIVGLSGQADDLAAVWRDYGIFVEKQPLGQSAAAYTVTHTARIFLIDQEGRLRLSYSFGTPYEDILSDLVHVLSEEGRS